MVNSGSANDGDIEYEGSDIGCPESDSDAPSDDDDEDIDGFRQGDPEEEEDPDYIGMFIQFMIGILLQRVISSKQFCCAMWFLSKAGISRCVFYGLAPKSRSGHYQRKVRNRVGVYRSEDMYKFKVVGRSRKAVGRQLIDADTYPAHELLEDDLRTNPQTLEALRKHIRDESLPPCYYSNLVVQAYGSIEEDPILPLGLFADGVPYSLVDSVIGFWVVNLVSGCRYLAAVLRKKKCCRCGCRGWCAFVQYLFVSALVI